MLERWKSIYLQSSQSISSEDSQSTLSTSESVDRHSSESCSPGPRGLPTASQEDGKVVNNRLQGQGINNSFLANSVHAPVQPRDSSVVETNCTAANHLSLMPSGVSFPTYLLPPEIQSSLTTLLAPANNSVQRVKDPPTVLTSLKREDYVKVAGNQLVPSSYSEALQARTLTLLPTTTSPMFADSTISRAAVDARFLQHHELPPANTVPTGWICDGDRRATESNMGELPSLLVGGEMTAAGDCGRVPSGPVVSSFAGNTASASDDLRVITSRLMKYHVEDLTLHHTPRGSGAGYGVGCHDLLQLPFTADLPSSELRSSQDA